jgi:hypothetical protein
VRVEGNCDDSDCRVADAFAGPLAGELARSTTVLMRPASGNDLRAAVAGYGAAWARLQAVQAERARPGDAIADLVSPPEPARTPPLPSAPLTIVRFPRVPR